MMCIGAMSDLAPQLALGVVQCCQQAIQVTCTRKGPYKVVSGDTTELFGLCQKCMPKTHMQDSVVLTA